MKELTYGVDMRIYVFRSLNELSFVEARRKDLKSAHPVTLFKITILNNSYLLMGTFQKYEANSNKDIGYNENLKMKG